MINSANERGLFFSQGTTRNSYLFFTESTIDQSPFLFGSIEYTHYSELHVTPTCQIQGIPILLPGMTVSYFESVKSKF